jgi:hypothetical protein
MIRRNEEYVRTLNIQGWPYSVHYAQVITKVSLQKLKSENNELVLYTTNNVLDLDRPLRVD